MIINVHFLGNMRRKRVGLRYSLGLGDSYLAISYLSNIAGTLA